MNQYICLLMERIIKIDLTKTIIECEFKSIFITLKKNFNDLFSTSFLRVNLAQKLLKIIIRFERVYILNWSDQDSNF